MIIQRFHWILPCLYKKDNHFLIIMCFKVTGDIQIWIFKIWLYFWDESPALSRVLMHLSNTWLSTLNREEFPLGGRIQNTKRLTYKIRTVCFHVKGGNLVYSNKGKYSNFKHIGMPYFSSDLNLSAGHKSPWFIS